MRSTQETPGLRDGGGELQALLDFILEQQAQRRRDIHDIERAHASDEEYAAKNMCVDAVLYFLPTNARVSRRDVEAMKAIGAHVPLLPVMCKVWLLNVERFATKLVSIMGRATYAVHIPALDLVSLRKPKLALSLCTMCTALLSTTSCAA